MPRDKTGHFYYSFYPTIFRGDTQHLTLAEDGAYRRLLDEYMVTRSPLPADDRALSRIVGVGLDEWNLIKAQLVSYFKPEGNKWRHTFCDDMLEADASRLKVSRQNGAKGGRPKAATTSDAEIFIPQSPPQPSHNPLGSPNTALNYTELKKGEVPLPGGSSPPPTKVNGHNRGSRLTRDWDLPVPWGQWAEAEGLSRDAVIRECDKFKDFWISKTGSHASKLDWEATWRNWIRRSMEGFAR